MVRPEERTGLGAEEWRWGSGGGPRTGQRGVFFGIAVVLVLVLSLVFGWPMLESRLTSVKARQSPSRVDPAELVGTWRGSFGAERHPGDLHLQISGDGPERTADARLVLDLDGNGLTGDLVGTWSQPRGELRLEGQGGTLHCRVDAFGVCSGTLRWGRQSVEFALVHMGR